MTTPGFGASSLGARAGASRRQVCGTHPPVREVFEISGFATIFTVFGSEQEAQDGF